MGQASFPMAGSRNNRLFFIVLGAVSIVLAGAVAGFLARLVSAGVELAPMQPTQSDVTYCTAGGVDLRMDIYAPPRFAGARAPAVMFVHGGAWSGGDKAS